MIRRLSLQGIIDRNLHQLAQDNRESVSVVVMEWVSLYNQLYDAFAYSDYRGRELRLKVIAYRQIEDRYKVKCSFSNIFRG